MSRGILFVAILAACIWQPLVYGEDGHGCRTFITQDKISLSECASGRSGKLVSLLLAPELPGATALQVYGRFGLRENGALFSRIWAGSARKYLSARDQQRLKIFLRGNSRDSFGREAFSLVKFLATFAPSGFDLRDHDLSRLTLPHRELTDFVMLCNKIGHRHAGYFSVGALIFRRVAVVGSHECMGRCGEGCADSGDRFDGAYTQECFNHDICRRSTGENLGVCEDEFWAAADGYLNGPSCE